MLWLQSHYILKERVPLALFAVLVPWALCGRFLYRNDGGVKECAATDANDHGTIPAVHIILSVLGASTDGDCDVAGLVACCCSHR